MPDERTYIRLHDGMPDHPKIDGLSDAAFRLLISTWCWSSRHLTDGRVPEATWNKRGKPRARSELVTAGLIEQTPDGSFMLHDYLEHQRSADEVAALREKRRQAGSKGGKAKANAVAVAKALAKQTGSKVVAESETDTEGARHTSSSGARRRATKIPEAWTPSPSLIEWQRSEGIADDLARRELPKFRDYWTAVAGDRGRKADWDATWRNWLRTARERAAGSRKGVDVDDPMGWAR